MGKNTSHIGITLTLIGILTLNGCDDPSNPAPVVFHDRDCSADNSPECVAVRASGTNCIVARFQGQQTSQNEIRPWICLQCNLDIAVSRCPADRISCGKDPEPRTCKNMEKNAPIEAYLRNLKVTGGNDLPPPAHSKIEFRILTQSDSMAGTQKDESNSSSQNRQMMFNDIGPIEGISTNDGLGIIDFQLHRCFSGTAKSALCHIKGDVIIKAK